MAGAAGLAGCGGWSASPPMAGNTLTHDFNISEASGSTQGPGFAGVLGKEYLDISQWREARGDGVDADYFARKSAAAAEGEAVPPENPGKWAIPTPKGDERLVLTQQRERLLTALDGGGRDRYPALAARAQSRYDCWIERTEMTAALDFNGKCHQEYTVALSDLEVLLHPPGPFHAYFDLDKANVEPDAYKVIREAAARIPQDGTARVNIVAHADRSGTDPHNMELSKLRADAVRQALIGAGISPDRIDVTWVGERDLPVPTPDGVREPRNRVGDMVAIVPSVMPTQSSALLE